MGKKEKDERFRKFGTVSFTGTTRVNDFIDHLEQGKVTGTRCKSCGNTFFPPRADCWACRSSEMEWFDVQGTGRLVTFSTLAFGPKGFEGDLPYTIALVDFGAYKVFGRIADGIVESDLSIGMALAAKANPLADGRINYVFHKQ
ncbi:MAG: Zn-ribbon domain-containing OB-fold protein [Deltaproteobacteria bacterium]|nr:Zn-ribbon domain-containing OB-fold protein [Deltaproteobacteria bacterium]